MNKFFYWLPRILGIIFVGFISIFALDAFSLPGNWWLNLVGFLIHLVPTYLAVIALLVAWKWSRLGGVIYVFLGVLYLVITKFGQHWAAYLVISGSLILTGVLFIINVRQKVDASMAKK